MAAAPTAAPAPKPRTRQAQMAPTAAPAPQLHAHSIQQQQQHYPFSSPQPALYDLTPESNGRYSPPVVRYIAGAEVALLLHNVREVMFAKPDMKEEEKRALIDMHFEVLQDNIFEELRRLKNECFLSHGLQPSVNKRPHDSDDPSSPESKRLRPEDEDDEVNAKGSWRCLFYEEQPDANLHCKDKRYKRVSELRRHIKTHTLPHHCEKCGYRTAEERRLQNHKCDPGNRKKYSPVTEQEKRKHEQLARMGIKVGQMRMILFGKEDDTDEHGTADDDYGDSDELPSRTPSINVAVPSMQLSPHQWNGNVSFPPYQAPIMAPSGPMSMPPTIPMTMAPSGPMYSSAMQMPMPMQAHLPMNMTPPFGPGSPHSPVQGHAAYYYNDTQAPDFLLYPSGQNTFSPDGSSSPPSHYSPPSHNHLATYTLTPEPGSIARTDSEGLLGFLHRVIPEGCESLSIRERSMPKSEIRAMEENMKKRARLNRALTATWNSRMSVAERSKNFLKSFSSRSKPHSDGSEPPKHRSFWRQQSAPPALATETRTAPGGEAEGSKEETGVIASIKKIFWLGVGRKRPGPAVAALAAAPVAVAAAPATAATTGA